MEPLSLGVLGLGALSAGLSIFGGSSRAEQIRAETAEMVRRYRLQGERTISEATALGAASGITVGSASLTKTLTDMTAEFRKQVDWLQRSGESQASAAQVSGLLGGLSAFGSSMFQFGALNNWFRSAPTTTPPVTPAGG